MLDKDGRGTRVEQQDGLVQRNKGAVSDKRWHMNGVRYSAASRGASKPYLLATACEKQESGSSRTLICRRKKGDGSGSVE